jgi:hypothetical protein
MAAPQQTAARQRWPAFTFSLLLHVGLVALLSWIDIAFAPPPPPHYAVLVLPDQSLHDKKIVWYDFHKAVPEVRPDRPFGPHRTPHGVKDPYRTLVTNTRKAPSTKQIIRQPEQPAPLPTDVPAPNLVSLAVKLGPKAFVAPAPARAPNVPAPATVEVPETLDLTKPPAANALGAIASLQKLPPKLYVPPAASGGGAKASSQMDVAVPSSLDGQGNQDGQGSQSSGLQALIIGLNPGTALPPPGSREGQIARAPEAGQPSSGALTGSGAIVPGVLSRGRPGEASTPSVTSGGAPTPAIATRGIPQDFLMPNVNRTMSAPLRPSARVIPASVEGQFARRDVYTMALPGPAVPGYGGDWVLWFAERDPEPLLGVRISAPVPTRKYSTSGGSADLPLSSTASTFQFTAMIDKAGRISSVTVLRGLLDPALRRKVVEELGSWEFKPALRNGEAMAVDVVLEIPFKFQAAGPAAR